MREHPLSKGLTRTVGLLFSSEIGRAGRQAKCSQTYPRDCAQFNGRDTIEV